MRLIGLAVSFGLAPLVARAQLGKAYRHYIRIVAAGFRRLVALGVIVSMTLTGCASAPYHYVVPDLRDRAKQIASIAAVPVDARMFRQELRGDQFSDEWSETARTNLRNAMGKYFRGDPHFAVKEFDPKGAETVQQELEQVRNVIEDIILNPAQGGICLPRPACACLSGPALALADAAGTDTLLLAYGRDRIKTAGYRAVIVITLVLALPLLIVLLFLMHPPMIISATDPPMSTLVQNRQTSGVAGGLRLPLLNAITLCLVDARQGDTLWFATEAIGTGDLRDASDVEGLIRDAYAKFRKAMGWTR